MERYITQFMVLFMQATAVSWLCLSTVRGSLKRPLGRAFLAFLPVNVALSLVYSAIPPVNVGAVVVVLACCLAGWGYMCLMSRELRGKLLFVLCISVAHLFLANTVWTLLSDVVRWFGVYDQTRWYNIVFLALPLAVFLVPFSRLLKAIWSDAAGLESMPWYRLASVPLSFILIYIAIYVLRVLGHDDMVTWHVMLVIVTICFFTTCSQLIFGLRRAAQAARYAENLSMAERQIEQQGQRFAEMAQHNREMKHLRHNTRQHANALYTMLAEKRYESAKEYTAQYVGEIDEIAAPPLCENEAVDSIVRYYLAKAQEHGVEAKLEIILPKDAGMAATDLCVMLGNLMENAIEACARMPKGEARKLDLRVTFRENRLLVSQRNSYGGQPCTDKTGAFVSQKASGGGLGLHTIQALAERYGGWARFYTEGQVFVSEVLMFGDTGDVLNIK